MVRYAAVALALVAFVGCRGEREREEAAEPTTAEYGHAETAGSWGDGKAEVGSPEEPLAYWPAVEYVYAGEWGKQGYGEGEFQTPQHIAVGPDGTVYVGEGAGRGINSRIQYFDRNGTYLGHWEVSSLTDIAVAPNGYVYVADSGNDRIQYFRPVPRGGE